MTKESHFWSWTGLAISTAIYRELISSVLLVQADEGVLFLVVDRIGDFYRNLPRRADVIVTTVGARHKCQQESKKTEFLASQTSGRRVRRRPHACASAREAARWGCARPPNHGRYSTCDCRTSPAKVCVRLARSCALLDAEESRDGRASGRRSMRVDGRCSSQGGIRDIEQRCDVEAPLVEGWPTRRRLPLRTSGAGCALAARCAGDAMRRWSAPLCAAFEFDWCRRPPAGRRSGESPTTS
ncbi:hypothetical protein F511_26794 [Dorcoceras hygrometricum]|uniref:Uncharacterized protein n=1 Tax=Dorcoceras hygrometricum TaxID=472368 RepID=A0A2Z7BUF3_9LAMI|nr:hypothetical protein F511_26794 [Dorcoceras hygrometricum]